MLRKIIFISLPSLLALIFLTEAGLRIAGFLYDEYRDMDRYKVVKDAKKGQPTILCIGDSYTYGMGASYEYSYPVQLLKALNKNNSGNSIFVKNLGSPGGNSYRILNIFRENIDKYNPTLVIVMVGMNNYWNMEGRLFSKKPAFNKLKSGFCSLRVYKLFKIIKINLKKKIFAKNNPPANISILKQGAYEKNMQSYKETGRSDLAIKETSDLLNKYPEKYELRARLVTLLREDGKYDLALENAKKALEHMSLNPKASAYLHLEFVYIYRAKKIWDFARKEMDYAIQDISIIQSVFPELRHICSQDSSLNFNQEIQKIRGLIGAIHGKEGTDILDNLLYLENNKKEMARILESDLLNLIDIAMKNDIELVFMTYPFNLWVNDIIRNTAVKHNITLVDNEIIFKRETGRERFFNLDSHCNELGYRLIAQNLSAVLLETKFFATRIK